MAKEHRVASSPSEQHGRQNRRFEVPPGRGDLQTIPGGGPSLPNGGRDDRRTKSNEEANETTQGLLRGKREPRGVN